jgi:hypothetical protein
MSKLNRYTYTDALRDRYYLPSLVLLFAFSGFLALMIFLVYTDTPEKRIERKKRRVCIESCELKCMEEAHEQ